ncbi:hypothetical protein L249_4266 [Ophiocordyceps polyrhachis-furcata BCC 54312]|uniref:Secreted protein n=1 Tax=Ophiocordyceps polyrhachis-furcata BCC 54312 TaxID=1330021 RepID=A0A367L863_9HYPO|nr:hypothetical protein L249_4266 [Ophiocordyceps polyrhachis-furcata BCC 54312]
MLAIISTCNCKSLYLVPLLSFSFSIALSAAPPDRAPRDTIGVLILYRRLYNPIRLGRNRPRPLYLLPLLLR